MVDCGSIALCIVTLRDLERANNKTNEKHCEKSLVDVKCPTRFLKQTTKLWKSGGWDKLCWNGFLRKSNKSKSNKDTTEIHFKVKQTQKLW